MCLLMALILDRPAGHVRVAHLHIHSHCAVSRKNTISANEVRLVRQQQQVANVHLRQWDEVCSRATLFVGCGIWHQRQASIKNDRHARRSGQVEEHCDNARLPVADHYHSCWIPTLFERFGQLPRYGSILEFQTSRSRHLILHAIRYRAATTYLSYSERR